MTDRTEVTVRVDADRYEEWKAVAEREYDGLSDLVRTAVENEIDGRSDEDETMSFSELLETLRNPYE